MQALAHNPKGMTNKPKGLTPKGAEEYVSKNVGPMTYSNLPEKAPKFSKLRKALKKK
jgi:hypothetical protein